MMSLLLVSGCTLGPKIEKRTVFVNKTDNQGNAVILGRVSENKKVKVELVNGAGEVVDQVLDIGGWEIRPPKKNR